MSAPNQTPHPRQGLEALIISVLCVFLAEYAGHNPDTASNVPIWTLASGLWFGRFLVRVNP